MYGLQEWWLESFTELERDFIRSKVGDIDRGESGPSYGIGGRQRSVTKFLTEVAGYFSRKDQVHIGLRILDEAQRPDMHPIDEHFHWMAYIDQRYKQRTEDEEAVPDVITACERMIEIAPAVAKGFKKDFQGAPLPRHPGFERLIIIRKKQKEPEEVQRLEALFEAVWGKHTIDTRHAT